MKIIALTGAKTVGKTTIAQALQKLYKSSEVKSFASPMKAMLLSLGVDKKYIEKDKEEPIPHIGMSARQLLCSLGTEWGRNTLGNDVWIKFLELTLDKSKSEYVIIDDCRFGNEAQWVRKQDGIVVRLEREGIEYKHNHITEYPIEDDCVDYVIDCDDIPECVEAIQFLIELQTDG